MKEGEDVAVLSIGHIGNNVTKAIEKLQEQGSELSVAHYDMRFLKPLDVTILEEVGKKFKRVVTIEDGVRSGGLGSAVAEYMTEHGYGVEVIRLGMPDDVFVEHGTVDQLQHAVGIDVDGIIKTLIQ